MMVEVFTPDKDRGPIESPHQGMMPGTGHIEPRPPEFHLNLPKSLRDVKTYAT
jgi:hypothetical protein